MEFSFATTLPRQGLFIKNDSTPTRFPDARVPSILPSAARNSSSPSDIRYTPPEYPPERTRVPPAASSSGSRAPAMALSASSGREENAEFSFSIPCRYPIKGLIALPYALLSFTPIAGFSLTSLSTSSTFKDSASTSEPATAPVGYFLPLKMEDSPNKLPAPRLARTFPSPPTM